MTTLDQLAREIVELRRQIKELQGPELPAFADGVAYTPTYLGGTLAGVTTYTLQQGWYWRIGRLVFVTGLVIWTAATGTGNAQISTPLPMSASVGFRGSGSCRLVNVTFANSAPQIIVNASAGTQFFILDSPLTNAGPTTVAMEAAGNITFSLFYGVD